MMFLKAKSNLGHSKYSLGYYALVKIKSIFNCEVTF